VLSTVRHRDHRRDPDCTGLLPVCRRIPRFPYFWLL